MRAQSSRPCAQQTWGNLQHTKALGHATLIRLMRRSTDTCTSRVRKGKLLRTTHQNTKTHPNAQKSQLELRTNIHLHSMFHFLQMFTKSPCLDIGNIKNINFHFARCCDHKICNSCSVFCHPQNLKNFPFWRENLLPRKVLFDLSYSADCGRVRFCKKESIFFATKEKKTLPVKFRSFTPLNSRKF